MRGNVTLSACTDAASTVARWTVTFVQGVAFWTAALLPLLYVPLLLVGHAAVAGPWEVGRVVGVHLAAIVVGHGYRASARETFDLER